MIAPALAALLLLSSNPAAQARDGYARCLKDIVRSSVEKKMDAAAFDAALGGACKDKEAAFRNAQISSDVAMGIKRPAAEKAMGEELVDYRSGAKEEFLESLKTNAAAPK